MNYAEIKYNDIANGIGVRTSLFVSGCTHHCKECFNPMTWDFAYGKVFNKEVEDAIIESLKPAYISGLTMLGGEPMEPFNQEALLPFYKRVRSECPGKTIWIYSGYTWEQLNDPTFTRAYTPFTSEILSLADILVDGEFVLEKKSLGLRFRGSSNQRIIDVPATLAAGEIVLSEYSDR